MGIKAVCGWPCGRNCERFIILPRLSTRHRARRYSRLALDLFSTMPKTEARSPKTSTTPAKNKEWLIFAAILGGALLTRRCVNQSKEVSKISSAFQGESTMVRQGKCFIFSLLAMLVVVVVAPAHGLTRLPTSATTERKQ